MNLIISNFYKKWRSVTGVKQIFSVDLRSLAVYRILLGSVLLLDVINRITLVPAFYSDSGIVPRSLADLGTYEYAYHFQLMMLSGSEWFSYLFLGILALFSLLLIAGYKTKPVTLLCWLFLCSLSVRNSLVLHAGDTLLTVLLFWGIFLPLGRTFSIDVLKQNHSPKSFRFFSAATVGLYIQFLIIYIMNGLYKGQFLAWVDGTHLYNTFSRFELIKPFALQIYPFYDVLSFLTQFSLYLELFGPLLFFIPVGFVLFRMVGIVLFLGLQLSIFLTFNIGLFPIVSLTGILVFLPTEFWDFTGERFEKKLLYFQLNRNTKSLVTLSRNLFSEVIVGVVTVYILVWNISEYSSKNSLPEIFKTPGYFLKLDQKWALFSGPEEKSEYLSVHATYSDSSTLDLMDDLKTTSTAINQISYATYNNYRWRIFFTKRVGDINHFEFMPYFIHYLVDQYGYDEASGKTLDRVDIIPHMHYIGERYNLTPLQTDIIYTLKFNE